MMAGRILNADSRLLGQFWARDIVERPANWLIIGVF
jgi:hypothetical protein